MPRKFFRGAALKDSDKNKQTRRVQQSKGTSLGRRAKNSTKKHKNNDDDDEIKYTKALGEMIL